MEKFFGILLIIFLVLVLFWPFISRWVAPALQRWIMGRFEDRMRRMAGMPTRKEERKMHRKARKNRGAGASDSWDAFRDRRQGAYSRADRREPIIPKEYAEDVEFVEIKSFSEETVVTTEHKSDGKERVVVESQVEDAEYTIIDN